VKRVTTIDKDDTYYRIVQTLYTNEVKVSKCNQDCYSVPQYTGHFVAICKYCSISFPIFIDIFALCIYILRIIGVTGKESRR